MRLKDKVALITGASHGIGKATAIAYANEGAHIAFTHLGQETGAAEMARLIEASGRRAHVMHADLTEATSCERISQEALEVFGRVDILVNNAGGGAGSHGDLASLPLDKWRYALDLNLTAPLITSQVIVAHMIERGAGGSVINISSVHASHVWPRSAAYGVAKAALDRLTKSMAVEWAPWGIRANAIAPGYINTAETDEERQRYDMHDGQAAPFIAVQRTGRPSEIAELAVFLASDASSYVTGQSILADGGLLLPAITTSDFMRGTRDAEAHIG